MLSLPARMSSRSFRKIAWITALVLVPAFVTSLAVAFSSDLNSFNNRYNTNNTQLNTCDLCHSPSSLNASQLNPYGRDLFNLRNSGSNINTAMATIENDDSDGDGETNIFEITNRTFPGDASSNSGGTPPPPPPPPPPPVATSVVSFTLINADTDSPIASFDPLSDGATLDLSTLPTQNLNIRANTAPTTVGSVIFDFDGVSSYAVENLAPYALESDSDGDYHPLTPALGSHTVTATPFDGADGSGSIGTALTINFDVTNTGSPPPPPPPPPPPGGGTTFFVAPNGSNSNPGTQSQPWATLQFAANQMQPGQTVRVENGTYAGFQSVRNGSATNPIIFMANGNNVVLDRPASGSDIINVEGHDGIIIDGFVVRNAPRVGIRAVECNDVIIRNNDIQNSSLDAILTGFAVRVQILNNICGNSNAEHGIYVSNSHGPNDNPIIRGNFCFGNGRSGIQMNGDCFTGPGDGTIDNPIIEDNIITDNSAKGISLISATNYRVANNILYDNAAGAAGIHCTDEPGCGNPSSGVIVNNTIVESRIACIRITDNSRNNTIFNNICVGGTQIADEVGASNIDNSSNLLQSGTGNLFVNPGNRDYRLASTSAAIDMGTASFGGASAPTSDAEGAARPAGSAYDAGAYEFGSSGPPPPPPPPPPTQPPAPPQGVTANETTQGCVLVSWQANGEADLQGYTVHWGPLSVAQGQATNYANSVDVGTSLSHEICGLSGNQFFAVRAYNTGNEFSSFSAERNVFLQTSDTTAPIVINRNPGSNATGIAVNSSVSFSLTDGGDGADNTSLVVTIGGNAPDNVVVTGSPARYDVVCDITADFPANTTIPVSVQISDLASPPNTRTSNWSFTTSTSGGTDTTPPVVSNETPTDGSTDVATMSGVNVNVSDAGTGVDLGGIEFYINNVLVPYAWTGGPGSATLSYNNQTGFTPNSTVTVRVDVCDLSSPPNCTSYQFSFETGTTTTPPPAATNELGAVTPNGYWKDDPTRPLEVRNMPSDWTVRIFNTIGQEIRRFTNSQGDGTDWAWDFTNDGGQRVAGGLYLIRVLDTGGTLRQTGRFIVQ